MKIYHWVVPFSSENRRAHLIDDGLPLSKKCCDGQIVNPFLATKPLPNTVLCGRCARSAAA